MSTNYYRLNPPITHLRLEDRGGHDRISIWVDHGLAGSLTVSKRETRGIIQMFSSDKCSLCTHWAGAERGVVVTVNDETIPDEAVVISEYGELLTVAEVKRRDGARCGNGMPTELFGYEKPAAPEPVALGGYNAKDKTFICTRI